MAYPVMPLGFLGSQGDNDTYRIERSLRFNSADSAYLNRTPASAGNRKTWTWSGWVKIGALSTERIFLSNTDTSGRYGLYFGFRIPNTLEIGDYGFSSFDWVLTTSALFRDTSAWYHIVASIDTTQATASNRVRLYVNGSQINSFSASTYPSQNADLQINSTSPMSIGRVNNNSFFYDGYITEVYFIDGQALTPSSFGETDAITGRWKAKAYSGTYGTNGFYLKFADNSGTTATTLGKDSSGNGNNWTPNNFSVTAGVGNDSLVDSPTNYGTDTGVGGEARGNYATLDPLSRLSVGATFSNGNLNATGSNAQAISSIAVSSGKWYAECTYTAVAGAESYVGVQSLHIIGTSATIAAIRTTGSIGYNSAGGSASKIVDNSTSSYGASWTANDVIGVALDLDGGKITFYKNGVSQGDINYTFSNYGPWVFGNGFGGTAGTKTFDWNFGQRQFAHAAPAGFKALCTTNLPTPTIQKPSSAMDVVTYTGNGSARSITGLGFSPDLVWIKGRSGATDHAIYDSVRGVQRDLGSNLTTDETTQTQGLTAFNSDGFDIGTLAKINTNISTYVAWAWDRAAIDGLDIVSYTGNGANRTIAHNLGVAPRMIIIKARTTAGTDQGWPVYHSSLASTQYLLLNSTAAAATGADYWNSTTPTASVFSLGTNAAVNANNDTYIAYLFAEVEGFSKFGSYTGNGSADGPFVFTGHRPRWVMIKRTDSATGAAWFIHDTGISTFNISANNIRAESSLAEASTGQLDILSNGFKLRGTDVSWNGSGATYIFAAFAESPFKYARAR